MDTLSLSELPPASPDTYLVHIEGGEAQTLSDFYDVLVKRFLFPDYFGRNLDALLDCLCALENIETPNVVLAIEHPELFLSQEKPQKRSDALQVLADAELPENRYDDKTFSVYWVDSPPVLVFATNNAHKAKEVEQILGGLFQVKTLKDIGCHEDIAETEDTLEGNALLKARYVKEHYGYDCFSEDTGLEVEALDGAPGVYTARYAGPKCLADDNIQLLLANLDGQANRNARFRTIIALLRGSEETLLEGICEGRIAHAKQGTGGFGYDPVFIPSGYDQTFAELGDAVKNEISHRAKATNKLLELLGKM